MTKKYLFQAITILLISLLGHTATQAIPHIPAPILTPQAPKVYANAHLLIDFNSKQVLASKNVTTHIAPASLTKMMTMYIIDNELKHKKIALDDLVYISKKAWRTKGSKMFIKVDTKIAIKTLIKGIIVQSGNDACVAMAEHIAGTESAFATLMNSYAKILGMNDSHFVNATGMPNTDHYSTAADLAILATAIIRDFPKSYTIYATKSYTYNNIKQSNRNRLLWHNPFVDGIKTGYTKKAGYCLVASGEKDAMRLIAITLGAKSDALRCSETNKLLSWGFRFFETVKLQPAQISLTTARIYQGKKKQLPLGTQNDFYVTHVRGQRKHLQTSFAIPKTIRAPITKGDTIGTVIVKLNNKIIHQQPLIALEDVAIGNIFKRGFDYILLKIHNFSDD